MRKTTDFFLHLAYVWASFTHPARALPCYWSLLALSFYHLPPVYTIRSTARMIHVCMLRLGFHAVAVLLRSLPIRAHTHPWHVATRAAYVQAFSPFCSYLSLIHHHYALTRIHSLPYMYSRGGMRFCSQLLVQYVEGRPVVRSWRCVFQRCAYLHALRMSATSRCACLRSMRAGAVCEVGGYQPPHLQSV